MDRPNADLCLQPLDRIAAALQAGTVSSLALTEAYLARIDALDGCLNSFITTTPDLARQDAQAADARRQAGRPASAIDGLPIALKDLLDLAGVPTTNGMALYRKNLAAEDAEVVRRLRAAGAVVLGKLNMHEAAMGASNDNPTFGPCYNPWRPGHSPGGSSGGSGAAVAAGLCAAALGTDNMGSVRIPASLCGVAGLKPTFGLVSTRGMMQLSPSTVAIGPLARGVAGVALMMAAMAGYDPACEDSRAAPHAIDFSVPAAETLTGVRIGVLAPPPQQRYEAEVQAAFEAALSTLEGRGAQLQPVAIEGLDQARKECLSIIEAEGAAVCGELLEGDPPAFSPDVLPLLRYGERMKAPRLVRAQRFRSRLTHDAARLFESLDALVTAACPVGGFSFAVGAPDEIAADLALANLCGLPALSVPMGFSADGLPLGLQIVAAPFADATALRIGLAYEGATDWHRRSPSLAQADG